MYNSLRECPEVYVAGFSGGGFRGSYIAPASPACRGETADYMGARYPVAHPEVADLYSTYFCRLDGPARLLNGHV
jgi:hypothetical protein